MKIDKAIIDKQIANKWRQTEGALLSRLGFPQEQHEAALNGWLEHAETRQEVERQCAATLVLRAVARKEGLLSVEDAATSSTVSCRRWARTARGERRARPREESGDASRLVDTLVYLRTAEHIWSKAKIETV